jgi:hypothetical protein
VNPESGSVGVASDDRLPVGVDRFDGHVIEALARDADVIPCSGLVPEAVFGDARRFPFAASRTYTPESASAAQLLAMHRALRVGRAVIVQPSVYGTDIALRVA